MPNITGERIRIARESKRMSQGELGKSCGITKQTIYKYETGVITNIPLDKLQSIADVLGVSSVYLAGWEDKSCVDNTSNNSDALSNSEARLVNIYRSVTGQGQQEMMAHAEYIGERYKKNPSASTDKAM